MKRLIGYVWRISGVAGDVSEIVSESDMLLITVKPHGKSRDKYRCEVTSPYGSGRIERTLGECNDWRYESATFKRKERHLLRGDVELSGLVCQKPRNSKSKHPHHIVMVYPDPLREGSLSGYILEDKDSGTEAKKVLAVIKKKYGKNKLKVFLHEGTYHSED